MTDRLVRNVSKLPTETAAERSSAVHGVRTPEHAGGMTKFSS